MWLQLFWSQRPKSPFISVCQSIMALSHILDRLLFRLAYISWHHRYYHITVYFGSAIVSRHRYSSRIIEYLITVACIGLIISHGYSAISVPDISCHPYLDSMSRKVPRLAGPALHLVGSNTWTVSVSKSNPYITMKPLLVILGAHTCIMVDITISI